MKTTKLSMNDSSHAVRLPKECRSPEKEADLQKLESSNYTPPKNLAWETFLSGVNGFTDDYFDAVKENHDSEIPSERELL